MPKLKKVTVNLRDLETYIGGINRYFGAMPFCFDDMVSKEVLKAKEKLEEAIENC